MSVIFHMLKEEFERLLETEEAYAKAIAKSPRGTLHTRKRRNSNYIYLEYRDGDKVIQQYIGPHQGDASKDIQEKVAQRKRYEKLLKETRSALKDVKKALRGKI